METKMGFVRLHEENTRIEEIPFMSETKWMAVKTKRTWAFGNEKVINIRDKDKIVVVPVNWSDKIHFCLLF